MKRKLLRNHKPPPPIPRHYVEPRPERSNEQHCGDSRSEIIERYVRLMNRCVENGAYEEVLAVTRRMEAQLQELQEVGEDG